MGKHHTEKEIIEKAKLCLNLKEFYEKYNGYYSAALRLGILNKLNLQRKRYSKHTEQTCLEKAKLCSSRGEFRKLYPGAYKAALHSGWINNYTWFSNDELSKNLDTVNKNNLIYIYEFSDAVYIGRTNNLKRRDRDHRKPHIRKKHKIEKSAVLKYSELTSEKIPDVIILEKDLSLIESRKQEGYWVSWYKTNTNKTVLNKGATGEFSSSIGGTFLLWTKDKILKESKKYKSRKEFFDNCGSAYNSARKFGILEELFPETRINLKKVIYQKSKEGYIINRFESVSDASKFTKINKNTIALCARGKRKTAGGYLWTYEINLFC